MCTSVRMIERRNVPLEGANAAITERLEMHEAARDAGRILHKGGGAVSEKTLLVNTRGRVHISQSGCPWLSKDKLPPYYKPMPASDVRPRSRAVRIARSRG